MDTFTVQDPFYFPKIVPEHVTAETLIDIVGRFNIRIRKDGLSPCWLDHGHQDDMFPEY